MGFFSKMLPIDNWSDEDLADELFKIGSLQVESIRNTPWTKPEKLDGHFAESKKLDVRKKEIEDELTRRGLTFNEVEKRKMMRLLGK